MVAFWLIYLPYEFSIFIMFHQYFNLLYGVKCYMGYEATSASRKVAFKGDKDTFVNRSVVLLGG